MPRRPRPDYRTAPLGTKYSSKTKSLGTTTSNLPRPTRHNIQEPESDSDGSQGDLTRDVHSGKYQIFDTSCGSEDLGEAEASVIEQEEEEYDPDQARVTQWVDEEELVGSDGSEGDVLKGPITPRRADYSDLQLKSLQTDLSSIPLGVLRRAQHALAQAKPASEDEGDDTSEGSGYEDILRDEPPAPSLKGKEKAKPEWNLVPRKDISKRSNKHAPIEVTSKRPVTRRRTVVEVKTIQSSDPRFLPMAGEFSAPKFQSQYSFLADIQSNELNTLKDSLKRARKLLGSSPHNLREDRQREVNRLELAVKRAESLVNKDKREIVESGALNKVARDEREKRKLGKTGWWMKNSDKKDLLMRARYEALEATGGKAAVKKAIAKKQKKIGQKEKKSRPFPRGRGGPETQEHGPRKRSHSAGAGSNKRRKVLGN